MGECYFCGGRPDIMCNGECQEPDYSELEESALSEQTKECDCNACTLCEYNTNNQKESSEVKV